MDALFLSRLQFAITPFIHFLFVPVTIVISYQVWAYGLFSGKVHPSKLLY